MNTNDKEYESMQIRKDPPWKIPERIFLEAVAIKYPNKEEQFERMLKVKKIKLCK